MKQIKIDVDNTVVATLEWLHHYYSKVMSIEIKIDHLHVYNNIFRGYEERKI